jgi:serine/threonine protein kinase
MTYMPPEAATHFGPQTDIWALGVIIHALAHGRSPFEERINLSTAELDEYVERRLPQVDPHICKPRRYLELCAVMDLGTLDIVRIDKPCTNSRMTLPYSRLLNHYMLCMLDRDMNRRITAGQLTSVVPHWRKLWSAMVMAGEVNMLNRFEDGRSLRGEVDFHVADSDVIFEVLSVIIRRSKVNGSLHEYVTTPLLVPFFDRLSAESVSHLGNIGRSLERAQGG